jgi:hypothetical protein
VLAALPAASVVEGLATPVEPAGSSAE